MALPLRMLSKGETRGKWGKGCRIQFGPIGHVETKEEKICTTTVEALLFFFFRV